MKLLDVWMVVLTIGALPAQDPWRYVVDADPTGDALRTRALPLTDRLPDDVEARVTLRGTKLRCGQLRFGDASGTRVAFVLDEAADGTGHLFLDVDRDRVLEDDERFALQDGHVDVELAPAFARGRLAPDKRTLRFRRGATGLVLGAVTRGYVAGTVAMGDRQVLARRYDGDGNGLYHDPADRLWLDLDGDRLVDEVREVMPYRAVQQNAGRLWIVDGDDIGLRLGLRELTERGAFKVAFTGKAKVTAVAVTLISREGLIVGLDAVDQEFTVPTGDYRITNLQVTYADDKGGESWCYVFSEPDATDAQPRHVVAADAVVEIDPVGEVTFTANCAATATAGGAFSVTPRLYTGDGLLIVTCFRGPTADTFSGPGALVRLLDDKGTQLGSSNSGFA